jgi:virulence-associated protein VapD
MDKLRITRQQLAAFIPDPLTLREFERLIQGLIDIGEEAESALANALGAQDTADQAYFSALVADIKAQAAQNAANDAIVRIEHIEATAYPSELSYIGW